VQQVPSYLTNIQERLLSLLSMVLARKPYYHPGTPLSFQTHRKQAAVALNAV